MSFLSSLFLIALPLVGVPIALHFYKGRQVDVIEWGAMHFLIDAVSDGRRWEKLEEILLMLLRVAAVAALVLALAQPMVRGSLLGVHDRREVVLVIDDSLSTSLETDSRSVFKQIQEEAIAAVNNLTSEDRVNVIAAAGGGRWITPEAIPATASGKQRLIEAIESLVPTQGSANLLDSLRAIEGDEASGRVTERLALVFTDGQASAFATASTIGAGEPTTTAEESEANVSGREAWGVWAAAQQSSEAPVTVRVVECGPGDAAPANLAIAAPTASRTVIRKGAEVTLTCEVANFGDEPSPPSTIQWRIAEEASDKLLIRAKIPSIAPGEVAKPTAKTKLPGVGPKLLECRLTTTDNLSLDQSAPLVIEVSDRLPVLIVHSGASDGEVEIDAAEHFTAALGYLDGQPQEWRSVYEPRVISPEQLSRETLSDYRAVVVLDAAGLDAEQVDRLRGFVAVGGGLWVTLGASVDTESFNALWHDDGEGLSPLAIEAWYGASEDDDLSEMSQAAGDLTIHPPEGDHPATRQLANTTALDIDKTLLARHREFIKPDEDDPLDGPATSVLLRSDAGAPLAVEQYYGRGRVIVQAFPLDLAWSDLPVRKAFVVMVHDWLDYLASPGQGRHNLAPGAPIIVAAPSRDAAEAGTEPAARVTPPSGEAIDLTPRDDLAGGVFRYTQTKLPGVYRVAIRAGGETLAESAYQTPRALAESRLDRLDDASRTWLAKSAGIAFDGGDSAPITAQAAASPPAPFWWTLLAALAALLVIELVMATHISWQRMGEPD